MATALKDDPAAAAALTELSLYPAGPDPPTVRRLFASSASLNCSFVTLFQQQEETPSSSRQSAVGGVAPDEVRCRLFRWVVGLF